MNILAQVIDKLSNVLIQKGAGDLWLKNIAHLRYEFLRHFYQEKRIRENVIISLTSYPPRFATLEHTIKTLLSQSVRPREVILWLYEKDEKLLPASIKSLQSDKFTIKTTKQNYRSYKKIYPGITEYQNDFILTADDDIFYNATWTAQILQHVRPHEQRILCHRAHRITFDENGVIKPYKQWRWAIGGNKIQEGNDIFFTGGAGALYPPGALAPQDLIPEQFLKLCPTADDVWLYFITTKNQYTPTKVPSDQLEYTWNNSQDIGLMHENVGNHKNDDYINILSQIYGKPWELKDNDHSARVTAQP